MQQPILIKEEGEKIFDCEYFGEEFKIKCDNQIYSQDRKDSLQSMFKAAGPIQSTEDSIELSPESKSIRNFSKALGKAVEEIRKGGSLAVVSLHYGIPEETIYQRLISRILPHEIDLLTEYEEKNLVSWIIRSNMNNNLILKHHLLSKVGKLKKVSTISPIFHKSKFGRMWYDYFLRTHPEIYENDGVLMPSNNINVKISPKKECSKYAKKKSDNNVNNTIRLVDLVKTCLNRKAVVVLRDFQKHDLPTLKLIKKENISIPIANEDQSENKIIPINEDTGNKFNTNEENVSIEHENDNLESKERSHLAPKIENIPIKLEYCDLKSIDHNVKLEYETSECKNRSHRAEEINAEFCWKGFSEEDCFLKTQNVNECSENLNKVIDDKPVCEKCNKVFCNKAKLQRHLLLHKPKELCNISCPKCSKIFPSMYHYNIHMKLSHSSEYYPCLKCNTVFKHHTSLTKHRKEKHSNVKLKPEQRVFICDICKKSYKYKNSLEEHIIYGHMRQKGKYSCDICNQNFHKFSHMTRHRLRHSKVKCFSCSNCLRTFSRKYLLVHHLKKCF